MFGSKHTAQHSRLPLMASLLVASSFSGGCTFQGVKRSEAPEREIPPQIAVPSAVVGEKVETLSELRRALREALAADRKVVDRVKQGERDAAILLGTIDELFSHPEMEMTFTGKSGVTLSVTKENINEHRALVESAVRETRFLNNGVLQKLEKVKALRPLTAAESAIIEGYRLFPDNPRRAHEAALGRFVIGDRPLGTLVQLCQVLASINSHDEPVDARLRADPKLIISELEVRKLIQKRGSFSITWTDDKGNADSLLITPENLEQNKIRVRDFMFSLRLRRNSELQRLAAQEQNGGLFPEEWIALLAVRGHPDDPHAAYIEARDLFLKFGKARAQ